MKLQKTEGKTRTIRATHLNQYTDTRIVDEQQDCRKHIFTLIVRLGEDRFVRDSALNFFMAQPRWLNKLPRKDLARLSLLAGMESILSMQQRAKTAEKLAIKKVQRKAKTAVKK